MAQYAYRRRYITCTKTSPTLDAVLGYIYRKKNLLNRCGRYAESVIEGLAELGLVKKVISRKGIFYFSTEKARNFKALDFAKEYLLAFHNTSHKKSSKILVFDESLPNGKDLVDVTEAIKKGMV